MIEKWKENLKNNFSNSPKAKIMVGVISLLVIALTITFTCVRKNIVIVIDGKEEALITYKGTVKDVLDENEIEIAHKDKVQPALNEKYHQRMLLQLKKL